MFSDTGKQKNWSENKAVLLFQTCPPGCRGKGTKNTAAHKFEKDWILEKADYRKAKG